MQALTENATAQDFTSSRYQARPASSHQAAVWMEPMAKELTDEEFAQRLREAGWPEDEIEAELKRIHEGVDESGYDGP